MQSLLKHIDFKAVEIAALSITDNIKQEILAYYEHIKADIMLAAYLRAYKNIIYHIIRVNRKNRLCHCLLGSKCTSAVNNGYICFVFLMEIDNRAVIDICNHIGIGKKYILCVCAFNKGLYLCQSLKSASVKRIAVSVRRKQMHTAGLSGKVPLIARTEMIHK